MKKILMVMLMLMGAGEARGEWGRTADDYIRLPLGSPPNYSSSLCSDLNGGCWVAGEVIGLCHVDRLGNVTWGDTALWFRETSFYAKLVPVDTNSVIVAMERVINDTTKVFLNRVNTNKELLWGEDGIALANNHSPQAIYDILPGPAPNTFLIHWAGLARRLQLINLDGEPLWRSNILLYPAWTKNAKILTTSDHCVIAAHPVDPYPAQNPLVEVIKINAEEEVLWRKRYAITSELQPTLRGWELSDVESDRDGGVILSIMYKRWDRDSDSLRYFSLGVMRVSGDGDSLWAHKIYERLVEIIEDWPGTVVDPFEQCEFILNYAGPGHFFAAWMDNLRHSDNDPFKAISFDADFELHWREPLDVIISPNSYYSSIQGVDTDSSICYVWRDGDYNREHISEQWGQRIGLDGERQWDERGRVIISRTPSHQSATTDCNGGIITTVDFNYPAVQMMNRNGEIGVVLPPVAVNENNSVFPAYFSTFPCYPNPFNSSTTISFSLESPALVRLAVYGLDGRLVKELWTGRDAYPTGAHRVVWNASSIPAGEYLIRLQAGDAVKGTKAVVIK